MNLELKLTVGEIVKSKHFQRARIIAGEEGIHRLVRWVHIIEDSSIESFLNGGELLLSTGIGWKDDEARCLEMIRQAIRGNAAAFCVELGVHISSIPAAAIDLARQHQFPLIVLKKGIRFIDITQDIHSLIIQKHYKVLSDLESYSNRLNQLLLMPRPQPKIMAFMSEHLQLPVLCMTNRGEIHASSPNGKQEEKKLEALFRQGDVPEKMNVAHQPVEAMNQTFADLFVLSESGVVTEFESLILDRTATALAQCFLRELYAEEQRKTKEAEWTSRWLEGTASAEHIQKNILDFESAEAPSSYAVVVCKATGFEEAGRDDPYLNMYIRSIFDQKGMSLFAHIEKHQLSFVLVNRRSCDDFKDRIQEGLDRLKQSDFLYKNDHVHMNIGVGKIVFQPEDVHKSYETAKETVAIREKMPNDFLSYFYKDLYIFRMVLAAHDQGVLQEFVEDYIGSVLMQDQKNGGELLKTLKAYLQCKGAKKETAEQLHIVRQTLYHRLDRLYELIGEDFMEPYKRQAIEVAICCYEFLQSAPVKRPENTIVFPKAVHLL